MKLGHILRSTLVSLSLVAAPVAASHAAAPRDPAATPRDAAVRGIHFNGRPATARDVEILARYEAAWGVRVPAGHYWYDNVSGAAGQWGGPTRGFLAPGLALGGAQLPANASGGGHGMLTGVFINGRELHPLDVQGLSMMLGQAPWPGQWWVDGQGWFGMPGQPPIGNLMAIAAQRQSARGGKGQSYYKSDIGTGSSTFVGQGCAAVHARTNPSSSDSSTYSYYVGCE